MYLILSSFNVWHWIWCVNSHGHNLAQSKHDNIFLHCANQENIVLSDIFHVIKSNIQDYFKVVMLYFWFDKIKSIRKDTSLSHCKGWGGVLKRGTENGLERKTDKIHWCLSLKYYKDWTQTINFVSFIKF